MEKVVDPYKGIKNFDRTYPEMTPAGMSKDEELAAKKEAGVTTETEYIERLAMQGGKLGDKKLVQEALNKTKMAERARIKAEMLEHGINIDTIYKPTEPAVIEELQNFEGKFQSFHYLSVEYAKQIIDKILTEGQCDPDKFKDGLSSEETGAVYRIDNDAKEKQYSRAVEAIRKILKREELSYEDLQ